MRVELFFKTTAELCNLVRFLTTFNGCKFHSFNLANKDKNDPIVRNVESIKETFPKADICAHYSLKYNTAKTPELAFDRFRRFLGDVKDRGASEVLLVSGGGEKKIFNSLVCLRMLSDSLCGSFEHIGVDLSVAYNPYFPDPAARILENQRLQDKLSTGIVSNVYLQFGSDIDLLKEGLDFLKTVCDGRRSSSSESKYTGKPIKIIGSVFIPSKQLLARMRFRPWNGVFLSEEFLSSVEGAERIVKEMLSLYQQYDVELLIETAFRNESEAEHLLDLLSAAGIRETNALLEKGATVVADSCDSSEVAVPSSTDIPAVHTTLPASKRQRKMQ
jgi:hypothetical protein